MDIKIITEGALTCENTPAHVVGLTVAGRDGVIFLLDTHLGIIYWSENCPGSIERDPSREKILDEPNEYAPENEQGWRWAPAWAVADFFELLKDEFRVLHSVPLSWQTVHDTYTLYAEEETGMIPMVQDIYRQHGWPDLDVYRKEDCLRAVKTALEERYPDMYVGVPVEDYEDWVNQRGYYASKE